ncbi:MAG: site-specific DNA-methyltransferase [Planctomycetota bacterium]
MTPYYEQNGITIYHGDCREVLPNLPAADLVLTDPPYGIKQGAAFVRGKLLEISSGKQGAWNDNFGWDWADLINSKPGSNWAVFSKREDGLPRDLEEWHRFYLVKKSSPPTPRPVFVSSVEQCLIGRTPGPSRWFGSGWVLNHWYGLTPKRLNDCNQTGHPAEKPVEAISILCSCLCDDGELVVDPFVGSGTSLVAAKRLGRRAIGIEIEERYCEIAANRLAQGVLFGAQGATP